VCVDLHAGSALKGGDTVERVIAVGAWRETPYSNDAERAALALAESVTRLDDRIDAVPDDVWDDATDHYDEQALAALVLAIATVNLWNRLNAATRQIAGAWAA
jgi:alkylhydroperoxidase family enzyme